MGWWQRLFNKTHEAPTKINKESVHETEWQAVSGYVSADSATYQLLSVLATAIAAEDKPHSQFVVKRVWQRNPEAQRIAVIAAALAAQEAPDSHWRIRGIYQKNKSIIKEEQ